MSRFRELRLFFGLDQASMARWFDTKQSVISLWEKHKRTPPLYEAAVRFGVSMDWLARLSRRMWGERVLDLAQGYRRRLAQLSPEERTALAGAAPSRRVLDAFAFFSAEAPDLVTRDYFALLLGLTPQAFELMAQQNTALSPTALERLADYTGVPERWFAAGDFALLEEPRLEEYYPLVHQLQVDGISPEDVRRVWNVIKTLR